MRHRKLHPTTDDMHRQIDIRVLAKAGAFRRRAAPAARCNDCNRIYRVPTTFDLSTTMMTEKFGGVHVRGVGNFVCAGTRDLRVAARANCPVCSVSCSAPATVTEIQPVTGTPHSWHLFRHSGSV